MRAQAHVLAALKDPIGANLDRIQIVKGRVDKDGKTQENLYGERDLDQYDRRVGADLGAERSAVRSEPARVLLARVIEIPTPRWTAYDAQRFGIKPVPGTAMVLQERAGTWTIRYTPSSGRSSASFWRSSKRSGCINRVTFEVTR